MKVLITGGAGYIGSTVATACLDAGIDIVLIDDLSAGYDGAPEGAPLYEGDIADDRLLRRVLEEHPDVTAVVHCAAKTVVPDSVADPLGYYDSNVGKTVSMLRALHGLGVERILFSSSASIYRAEGGSAIDEDGAIAPASPYAATKVMVERILEDAASAGTLRAVALRYFNPIGADPELRVGLRNPEPSHVVGRLIRAWQRQQPFTITGVDWPTHDGTGVRDFIHVWDLALAHVRALELFDEVAPPDRPFRALNVGTGSGVTVRQLVDIFQTVVHNGLEVAEGPRRPGDSAGGFAAVDRAAQLLGWRAERSVERGVRDALAWSEKLRSAPGS